MDDFLIRALLAGCGIAIIAGPLGCLMIWRRMSFLGDTLAHAALVGVALSLWLQIPPFFGVIASSLILAAFTTLLQRQQTLPNDAVLGLLSYGSLALGLVALSFFKHNSLDLNSYLFGDILATGWVDIGIIYGGGAVVLGILKKLWNPLLHIIISTDMAAVEGIKVQRVQAFFVLLISFSIALFFQIIGALLLTALLILPAATARQLVRSPEGMAFGASLIGCLALGGGIFVSLHWDTPSSPTIVLIAFLLFLVSALWHAFGLKFIKKLFT